LRSNLKTLSNNRAFPVVLRIVTEFYNMNMFSTTLLLLATTVAAQTGHEGHDHAAGEHGKGKWEWIGAFDLHEVAEGTGTMKLTLSQKDGKWAGK
jgi:hypothetical protein